MIETIKAKTARNVRGTKVEKGQTIYCIKKGDMYFIWSYSDEAFANQMDHKLSLPVDSADLAANWRASPHDCVASGRKSFNE